jgi:hypothetical protein
VARQAALVLERFVPALGFLAFAFGARRVAAFGLLLAFAPFTFLAAVRLFGFIGLCVRSALG